MNDVIKYKEYNCLVLETNTKLKALIKESENYFKLILNYNKIKEQDSSVVSEKIYNDKLLEYKVRDNFLNVQEKLQKILELTDNYININGQEWNEYNNNYISYLTNEINNIFKFIEETDSNIEYQIKNVRSAENILKNQATISDTIEKITISNDILKYFSHKNSNYIIFGKNGSGKTSLLKRIKNNYFNDNSYVIPSNKIIEFGKNDYIGINDGTKVKLKEVFSEETNSPNDKLTFILNKIRFEELLNENTTTKLGDTQRESAKFNKIIKIFNSLGIDRKIKYNLDKEYFELYNDEINIDPYYIKNASDGEKSIFLYIAYVMLCSENSFIFIDEPESHLNDGLLCELFTKLEKERKDMVFIYCTHNINFIESRSNAKLLYLNSYDGDKWDIKETDTYDKIELSHLISIIGTKKDVIFVESEKAHYDYKLYSNLFDNYQIIPVDSCEKVIENCKTLNNGGFLNLNRKFYGIIDNDYRSNEEMEKYLLDKIFVLTHNEIENLLLSNYILDYICLKYGLKKEEETIKAAIIEMAEKNKNGIITDYINKKYERISKYKKNNYDGDSNKLIENINRNNRENSSGFKTLLDDFVNELTIDIKDKNYNKIIKKYANKGFKSCISSSGIRFDIYFKWVLDSINEDIDFKNLIKEKLFNNYFD